MATIRLIRSAELAKKNDELDSSNIYLKTLLNSARDVIYILDKMGRFTFVNEMGEQLTGFKKEEWIGKHFTSFVLREDIDKYRNNLTLTDSHKELEMRVKSVNNSIIYLSVTSTPIIEDGKIKGSFNIARDITFQKLMELKMIQTEKLSGIGTLAAGIAHEINNPLQGIIGLTETMKMSSSEPKNAEKYEKIIAFANRAANIVKDLSVYARQSRDSERSITTFSDIIDESIRMVSHSKKFNNIEVVTEYAPNLPNIIVDRGEFGQVFINLVSNAIDSIGTAGKITIKTAFADNIITIVIEDNGSGIPKENLNRVFDPFFTTKETGKGTGLGLTVVYTIVRNNGGDIAVESSPETGTRFTLTFDYPKLIEERRAPDGP